MNPNDFKESEYENVYSVEYKGRKIIPKTYQYRDTGKWSVAIQIMERDGGAENLTPYYASNAYDTKEKAIEACVTFGKQIIDGKA